uniref:Uncharacterized protein n=1 Tax=Bionectria ochroleuca TaxID=29856 RepID=A0A8H7N0C5_BIOOC
MAATSAISQVPADVIAHNLSNLEAIEDLAVAIRSHRIFLNAFNEGPYSIARAIVKSQIPSDATPLVAALLESTRIDHGAGIDISREILDRLTSAISDPNQTTLFYVSKLSLSELAFCSRIYATAESLAYKMAAEVKPIAIQKLDFGCSTLQHLTSTEKARLVRAFLRFQLLCDLFCPPDSACPSSNDGNSEERAMENKLRFFSMYSPWVNEHLMCAFTWLQRILRQAFDELAWHDVDWGRCLSTTVLNQMKTFGSKVFFLEDSGSSATFLVPTHMSHGLVSCDWVVIWYEISNFRLSNSTTDFLTNVSLRPLAYQTWTRRCKTGQRVNCGLSLNEETGRGTRRNRVRVLSVVRS